MNTSGSRAFAKAQEEKADKEKVKREREEDMSRQKAEKQQRKKSGESPPLTLVLTISHSLVSSQPASTRSRASR